MSENIEQFIGRKHLEAARDERISMNDAKQPQSISEWKICGYCTYCGDPLYDNGTVAVHKRREISGGGICWVVTQWCFEESMRPRTSPMAEVATSLKHAPDCQWLTGMQFARCTCSGLKPDNKPEVSELAAPAPHRATIAVVPCPDCDHLLGKRSFAILVDGKIYMKIYQEQDAETNWCGTESEAIAKMQKLKSQSGAEERQDAKDFLDDYLKQWMLPKFEPKDRFRMIHFANEFASRLASTPPAQQDTRSMVCMKCGGNTNSSIFPCQCKPAAQPQAIAPKHGKPSYRESLLETVTRILIENKPGAALNAAREDYPELARAIDNARNRK